MFAGLSLIVVILVISSSGGSGVVPASGQHVAAFLTLRNNYILVFSLMMGKS